MLPRRELIGGTVGALGLLTGCTGQLDLLGSDDNGPLGPEDLNRVDYPRCSLFFRHAIGVKETELFEVYVTGHPKKGSHIDILYGEEHVFTMQEQIAEPTLIEEPYLGDKLVQAIGVFENGETKVINARRM